MKRGDDFMRDKALAWGLAAAALTLVLLAPVFCTATSGGRGGGLRRAHPARGQLARRLCRSSSRGSFHRSRLPLRPQESE